MLAIIFVYLVIAIISVVVWAYAADFFNGNRSGILAALIAFIVLAGGYTWYLNETASGQRQLKSADSNISGGLQRTVEVYDYNGDLIKTYKGKIDLRESEKPGEKLFDLNGKRVTINNGIIISEEK